MDTQPASRDCFFYDGRSLYVVIDTHRVERASPFTIHSLLTSAQPAEPVLTKKGTVAKRQQKDSPGYFYCGQLLHYGLKPLKAKEPAKKQLLAAFGDSRVLEVPERILLIERELKEEYEMAKANQLRDRSNGVGGEGFDMLSLDGEQEESPSIQDSIDAMSETDLRRLVKDLLESHPVVEETVRTHVQKVHVKAGKQPQTNARPAVTITPTGEGRPRQTARCSRGKTRQTATRRGTGHTATRGRPLQTARKQTARRARPFQPRSTDRERSGWKPQSPAGEYDITAPKVTEEWGYEGFNLSICPSSTHRHLWGSFELGIIEGYIRSVTTSTNLQLKAGLRVDFKWRGSQQNDAMTFEEGNTGHFVFLAGGKIKGKFKYGGYSLDIAGVQISELGPADWGRSVSTWKFKWRGYNKHNYEVERVARWGKWGGDRRNESPADSDTSGRGTARESDDEVDDESDYY